MEKVKKLFIARTADEANQKLDEGWDVLQTSIGLRRIHHLPDPSKDKKDTEAYDFDIPFVSILMGLSNE